MTTSTRLAALLSAALTAGCATGSMDPHRPKTIVAKEEGGPVSVAHGQRLRLPVAGEDWRLVEPRVQMVVLEAPPDAEGLNFTPVRTGRETLRIVRSGRTVSYDVEVK
jgi:hypothetical protein